MEPTTQRQKLVLVRRAGYTSLDKWLLVLSGAGLGSSLVFLDRIVPYVDKATWLYLIIAWSGFCASIATALFSLLNNANILTKQLARSEGSTKRLSQEATTTPDRNMRRSIALSRNLSGLSIVFLVLGIYFLCFFKIINLAG